MTTRRLSILFTVPLLASLASLACGGSASTGDPSAPSPSPTSAPTADAPARTDLRSPNTLEGIYTAEQAERGLAVFEETCSVCHEKEDWLDEFFLQRWDGESVYRFWYYVYENMPNDAPPYSMPREEVTDVFTYILQLNGVPAGDTELGSTDDDIDPYWLYWSAAGE